MSGALTILHNPRCSTSCAAVDIATEAAAAGRKVRIRSYLKEPLSEAELVELIDVLADEPTDLVRRDKKFAELGLQESDVASPEQVVAVLVEHPELLQRPVLISHDADRNRAIIGRPRDRVAAFLAR